MQLSDSSSRVPPRSPAEIYDELFVPALFRQWAPALVELSGLRRGQRVLDVACGTGALTCQLSERVGPDGSVVGLDANPAMLQVARTKSGQIEWIEAPAEALPFAERSFDAVVSQFGLMFFQNRAAALREMARVLRPGGGLAIAVWDRVEHCPGYAVLEGLLRELFGAAVADAFHSPFQLGEPEHLLGLAVEAGIAGACVTRREGLARFPSLEALLRAEQAWLGGMLDQAQFERLLARARPAFQPWVTRDAAIEFACPAWILSATRA